MILSVNEDGFPSFLFCGSSMSFSSLIALPKLPSIMLKKVVRVDLFASFLFLGVIQ